MEQSLALSGNGLPSFADFYRTSAYSRFPQEHRTHAGGALRAFTVDQQAHDFADEPTEDWVLGLPLRANCPARFDIGDGWRGQQRSRGDFLLIPPRTHVRYEIAGPTRLLVLTWPAAALQELDELLFEPSRERLAGLCARFFRSSNLEATVRAIWQELGRDDGAAQLLLSCALAQVAAGLLRAVSAQERRSNAPRNEIRRAIEFIERNFAHDLSLGDIAAVSGLSLFHFTREFQAVVGNPPYRYLLQCRARAALEMFNRNGRLPSAEVAARTGFSSVRTMQAAIRRLGTGRS